VPERIDHVFVLAAMTGDLPEGFVVHHRLQVWQARRPPVAAGVVGFAPDRPGIGRRIFCFQTALPKIVFLADVRTIR